MKPMTISKKAKGFPVSLFHLHWFTIEQMYPWLQSIGATTPETDEAFALIPKWGIGQKEIDIGLVGRWLFEARSDGVSTSTSKTIRVRAAQLDGMIRLLNLCAAFQTSGQLSGTIWRRAALLESVDTLDRLADASR
jgi:hypothetical protein